MKFTRLLIVSMVILLEACAIAQITDVPSKDEASQIEKARVYQKSYDAVWAATIKSLATNGVPIQSQDKASGSISTDWMVEKEAIGIFTTGSRVRANILVEKQGETSTLVTVTPAFQIKVSDKANWSPTQRKRQHVNAEKRLLDAIQTHL